MQGQGGDACDHTGGGDCGGAAGGGGTAGADATPQRQRGACPQAQRQGARRYVGVASPRRRCGGAASGGARLKENSCEFQTTHPSFRLAFSSRDFAHTNLGFEFHIAHLSFRLLIRVSDYSSESQTAHPSFRLLIRVSDYSPESQTTRPSSRVLIRLGLGLSCEQQSGVESWPDLAMAGNSEPAPGGVGGALNRGGGGVGGTRARGRGDLGRRARGGEG